MQNNLKSLKILVYAMGITMIIGVLVIMYALLRFSIHDSADNCKYSATLSQHLGDLEQNDYEILNFHNNILYVKVADRIVAIDACDDKLKQIIVIK